MAKVVRQILRPLKVPTEEAGSRLDRFLGRQFPAVPNSLFQRLSRTGKLRLEGHPRTVGCSHRLKQGDVVLVPELLLARQAAAPQQLVPQGAPEWLKSAVLYADDNFFVLNKPADLVSQPGCFTEDHDVASDVQHLRGSDDDPPLRLVHRLDRNCTGTVVVARNLGAAQFFSSLLRDHRRIKKTYWAVVYGKPRPPEGRVRSEIQGKHAVTEYRTVRTAGASLSWLELFPVTGRKRQLRNHCAEVLRCPIVGDDIYTRRPDDVKMELLLTLDNLSTLHLHARAVQFQAPDGRVIDVAAPVPQPFLDTLKALCIEEYVPDDMPSTAEHRERHLASSIRRVERSLTRLRQRAKSRSGQRS